jgi:hypothetical protein
MLICIQGYAVLLARTVRLIHQACATPERFWQYAYQVDVAQKIIDKTKVVEFT